MCVVADVESCPPVCSTQHTYSYVILQMYFKSNVDNVMLIYIDRVVLLLSVRLVGFCAEIRNSFSTSMFNFIPSRIELVRRHLEIHAQRKNKLMNEFEYIERPATTKIIVVAVGCRDRCWRQKSFEPMKSHATNEWNTICTWIYACMRVCRCLDAQNPSNFEVQEESHRDAGRKRRSSMLKQWSEGEAEWQKRKI